MIKLTIHDIPSSNNTTQGKGGVGRALQYAAEKKRWAGYCQVLRAKMREYLIGTGLPHYEATIIIQYHFKSTARRDPDNYAGKLILDGLVSAAFITDDSFREINILPLATFGNKKASTDIYIIPGKRLDAIAKNLIDGEEYVLCGQI